jgi:hypothetical protein
MKKFAILVIVMTAFGVGRAAFATLSYSTGFSTLPQNFDSLGMSGTPAWTNNSTIPGWYLFNGANAAITSTYRADPGTSNSGSFYSFGAASTMERSLGGVASGGAYFGSPASNTIAGYIAVGITNNLGVNVSTFTVGFDGEQWRDGGLATGITVPSAQTMVLEYGFGATFAGVTTWTAPGGSFNFASPVFTSTTSGGAAVVGNSAGLTAGLGGTVTGATWAAGDTLWIRWIERNDIGNDHGLSVDNFRFASVPEPSAYLFGALATILGGGAAFGRRLFARS